MWSLKRVNIPTQVALTVKFLPIQGEMTFFFVILHFSFHNFVVSFTKKSFQYSLFTSAKKFIFSWNQKYKLPFP